MDGDKKLENQISEYQKLAAENKEVDVASLMINALQHQDSNLVPAKQKRIAYLISIGAPPFGLLWALKYYMSDEDDARQVANVCVLLTVIAVVALIIITKLIFSSAGVSTQQIQQIKPQDIQQLLQ